METAQRKIVVAVSCVVLIGSLVSLWLRFRTPLVKIDPSAAITVNTGLGQVLAEETVKAAQDRGQVVLVTRNDPVPTRQQLDPRWKAFQSEMQKHGAIRVTTESVNIEREPSREFVAPGTIKELLDRNPDAAAMVLLVELPEWVSVSGLLSERSVPKIIAVDFMGRLTTVHYGGYFENGILSALIGRRSQPPPAIAGPPRTPREAFDQHYQVYTEPTFATLSK